MTDTAKLRKASQAVYLVTEERVARSLSDMLIDAAATIDELKDFAIWMTGCGYDFCQHDYFCKKRDKLLR